MITSQNICREICILKANLDTHPSWPGSTGRLQPFLLLCCGVQGYWFLKCQREIKRTLRDNSYTARIFQLSIIHAFTSGKCHAPNEMLIRLIGRTQLNWSGRLGTIQLIPDMETRVSPEHSAVAIFNNGNLSEQA